MLVCHVTAPYIQHISRRASKNHKILSPAERIRASECAGYYGIQHTVGRPSCPHRRCSGCFEVKSLHLIDGIAEPLRCVACGTYCNGFTYQDGVLRCREGRNSGRGGINLSYSPHLLRSINGCTFLNPKRSTISVLSSYQRKLLSTSSITTRSLTNIPQSQTPTCLS
jgi:hypothetical protein